MKSELPTPKLVNDARSLARFIEEIHGEERLAIDTEANSMYAYRERVCLIQVSSRHEDYIVDPLAGFDLDPFFAVFEDENVLKVFHDAEFDLSILGRDFGRLPRPVFDTKIAAVTLGKMSYGLSSIVESYFGVKLDKKQQRSNWGKRPLDVKQLNYARLDTHYLLDLADRLEEELAQVDPLLVLEMQSEVERLLSAKIERKVGPDPDAFLRVKGARKLPPEQLRALKELYDWREGEAERRDLPLFKILANHQLLLIAIHLPSRSDDLPRRCELPNSLAVRYGKALIAVLSGAGEKPGIAVPRAEKLSKEQRAASQEDQRILDELKLWRKSRAEQRPTDPSHILNREVMEELSRLRPRPATLVELEESGKFEAWRLAAYGSEVLDAIAKANQQEQGKR